MYEKTKLEGHERSSGFRGNFVAFCIFGLELNTRKSHMRKGNKCWQFDGRICISHWFTGRVVRRARTTNRKACVIYISVFYI